MRSGTIAVCRIIVCRIIVCRIIVSRIAVSRIAVSRTILCRLAGILLSLILLAGCAGKDKVTSGIIPIDKMKTIVWDMIQADTYTDLYLGKDSVAKARLKTLQLYAQVLQLHQVSREDFRKSFQFYTERPDLTRELFDSVQALGARDRAAHPPVMQSKALPAAAKGGIPIVLPDRIVPNRPGIQPTFRFQGRAPHGLPPNGTPGSHPTIPPPHPTIPAPHSTIPPPHPTPGAMRAKPSDSSTHHHRAPAISKPNTKDII